MKKILLTILGLALASPAWSAQTEVTQIGGIQASVGALKTQTNLKLGTVELNRQDHETRVAAMESGKAAKPYINASAPADTSLDWYDTDQEPGVWIHKKHSGATWERVGSHGVQYLPDCAGIAAGLCVNTSTGKLYYHNNTSVVEAGTASGSYTLPTASANTLGGVKVGARLTITDGILSADVQSGTGAVDSVNGATGTIVLDADDINDTSTTKKFTTAAEKATWSAKQNALVVGTDYLAPNGSATNLTNFPTFNQSTTGSAGSISGMVTSSGITGALNLTKTGTTARTVTFQDAAGTVALTSDIVAAPTDATLSTTDVTTNNASTTKHGWLLKATAPSSGLRNIVAIDNAETVYKPAALFDTTSPSTQAFGDTAVVGTAMTAARRDHKHAMPAAQTTITGNAGSATVLQTARTIGGTSFNGSANIDINYANLIGLPTLGTAAALNVGTGANNIVQLNTSGQLPFSIDIDSLTATNLTGTSKYYGTNALGVRGVYDLPSGGGAPTTITVANTTDTTAFVAIFDSATGDLGPKSNNGLTFNATTGMLTATGFTGPLTGTASGNLVAGGNIGAATATTPAANDNDTSVATTAYIQTELGAYASDTVTFTGKSYDVAGTGNSFTDYYGLPITIISPVDTDDPLIDKPKRAITLTGIDCVAIGGGTISVDLQECDANGATCTTTGATIAACGATNSNDAALTDTAVAAGNWLKLVIGAPSGTVGQVAVKVYGTEVK